MTSDESSGAKQAPESPGSEMSSSPWASRPDAEELKSRVSESGLSEDAALSILKRADLPADALAQLGNNGSVAKSRKVKLALVEHPKTPRHVSHPLVRQLYTFDLMRVALTPVVPADVKLAADEALCSRLETLAWGERLTLAHRGSGRIAEALLSDPEVRAWSRLPCRTRG
jgi:hypothetical protein